MVSTDALYGITTLRVWMHDVEHLGDGQWHALSQHAVIVHADADQCDLDADQCMFLDFEDATQLEPALTLLRQWAIEHYVERVSVCPVQPENEDLLSSAMEDFTAVENDLDEATQRQRLQAIADVFFHGDLDALRASWRATLRRRL